MCFKFRCLIPDHQYVWMVKISLGLCFLLYNHCSASLAIRLMMNENFHECFWVSPEFSLFLTHDEEFGMMPISRQKADPSLPPSISTRPTSGTLLHINWSHYGQRRERTPGNPKVLMKIFIHHSPYS